jgi:hypothetical protein
LDEPSGWRPERGARNVVELGAGTAIHGGTTMNPRESDPTGAFSRGGAAGLQNGGDDGDEPIPLQPPTDPAERIRPGIDETEREVITSGTAATSEVADRDAQDDAEGQGDGVPLPE